MPASVLSLLAALLGAAATGRAQLPPREPLPWEVLARPAERQALVLDASRFTDPAVGWRAQRLGVAAFWPRGPSGCLFLRAGWYALDTGNTPVSARWPALTVPGVAAAPPTGDTAVGWGSPEVGWLSTLQIGSLGVWQYAFVAALPLGWDELYPFASTSLPFRFQLRRPVRLGDRLEGGVLAGLVVVLDSGRDRLDPAAYPGGTSAALDVVWHQSARHALTFALAAESGGGASALQPSLAWRLPAGGRREVTFGLRRDLSGVADRAYATQVWFAWTIRSAVPAPPAVAK
ncbi:MAG: hypothetical protein ACYDIE_06860 [Candidatus Krumholzibacteriia bacterium]